MADGLGGVLVGCAGGVVGTVDLCVLSLAISHDSLTSTLTYAEHGSLYSRLGDQAIAGEVLDQCLVGSTGASPRHRCNYGSSWERTADYTDYLVELI